MRVRTALTHLISGVATLVIPITVFWLTFQLGRPWLGSAGLNLESPDDALLGAAITLAIAATGGCITVWRAVHIGRDHATPPPDPSTPEPFLFGMVPQEAQHYLQRPFEFGRLRAAMHGASSRGRAKLVAIVGQRGVGKTQLAASYARDCVNAGYTLVAWINASGSVAESLARLAQRMGLKDGPDETVAALAAKIRPVLERNDGLRRLVIFDDAGSPASIAAYLPAVGNAEVIITSTEQRFADVDGLGVVPVGIFSDDQGRALLHKATGLPEDGAATAVGDELGWLPLALAQAAAVIKRQRYSYAGYLHMLHDSTLDEALPHIDGGAHRQGAVRATLLAIDAAARRNPLAARVLETLALLDPAGTRRKLLIRQEAAQVLASSPVQLRGAVADLADASLLSFGKPPEADPENVSVVVHRVTARILRERAEAEARWSDVVGTATTLLAVQLRALPLATSHVELTELVRQVEALRDATKGTDPNVLRLCNFAANRLQSIGDLTGCIALYELTLEMLEGECGRDHPDTISTRKNLATAWRQAGRLGSAMPLFEETLANFERVLGTDHPDTLVSRDDLGVWYWIAGRLAQAIVLFEQNLADRERMLGPEHVHTLGSRNNLALVYVDARRIAEGIALHERTFADRLRLLGPDDTQTLSSRNNLALALVEAGRVDEAIEMHRATIADRKRVLGGEHIATLGSRNNLGLAYLEAGQISHAVRAHQATLRDRERILGLDHPNTLGSRNNLALALAASGQLEQARLMHERTLAEREQVLGPDHPDVFGSRNNLALAYWAEGNLSDALRLLEQALADRERMLSPGHPDTEGSRRNLALARAGHLPQGLHVSKSATRSVPIPITQPPL